MAVKDIFTRTTIIPTDRTRGNVQNLSRDEQAILNVQQERYKTQQMAHYTRRSIPIKESVVSKIQQKIDDYKQRIEKAQKDIEYYDRKQNETKSDSSRESYRRSEDSAYNEKSSYEEGLRVLQQELDKYNKITDPLEIVGIGDEWGKEVVNYASDVRYNEYRYLEARDEQKRQFREYKNSPEFKDLQATYGLNSNISQSDFNKFVNKINTTGQYNVKTGEFYPTTNKDWAPKGVNMNDVVFINQGLTMWDKVETKLSDGTKLLQFKNPGNPNDIINIGTILPTKEVKPMQTPTKEVTVSLGPNPIKFKDAVKTAPTLGEKIKVGYGYLDKSMGGYLPGGASPAEVKAGKTAQAKAEEFSNLVGDEDFIKVFKMSDFNKQDFFSWKGINYREDTALKALTYITEKDIEKKYEREVIPKVEVYAQQYNNEISIILESNNPNTGQLMDEAYKIFETKVKDAEGEWKVGAELLIDERSKMIEKFKDKTEIKKFTAPKILATATAVAATAAVAVPAAAGAFGAAGAAAANALTYIGYAGISISGASLATRLYNEKINGTLTWSRAGSIIGPQIGYLTAGIIGGAIGGAAGMARFKKAQTEFLLNMDHQLRVDTALQKKVFSQANLNRGYAEMKVGKYIFKFNVNEKMLANYQAINAVMNGKVIKKTEFLAVGFKEQVKIKGMLNENGILNPTRDYVIEGSIGKVKSSVVSKVTGKQIYGKDWYAARVMINNKQADLLFTMSSQGKIMNPYVLVSTEVQPGYWLVNVGKITKFRKLSIPVEGQNPIIVSQVEHVTPVTNYIVQNKGSSGYSILRDDGVIISIEKNSAFVKQITNIKLQKSDSSLFSFLTEQGSFDISRIPKAKVGTRTQVESVRFSIPKKDTLFFREGVLDAPKSTSKSIFLDIGKGRVKDPVKAYFDSIGRWFSTGSPKTTKAKIPTAKDTFGFDTKHLLGSSPMKSSSTPFNTDYLLGATSKAKVISIPKTTQTSTILNMDYLLGATPKTRLPKTSISPSLSIELSPTIFGGFPSLFRTTNTTGTKSNEIQSSISKQRTQDLFGMETLSKNLTRTITAPVSKTEQRQKTIQTPTQKQKEVQLQKQQQLQRTQDIFGFQSMFRPTPQITPKINKPKIDPFKWEFPKKEQEPPKKKVQKTTGLLDWGYVAEVRRQGKFKPVARTASAEEAFWIGKGVVDNTLGASFRVIKIDKKDKKKTKPIEDIFSWGIPKDFYTKQEKGETIFIEKRGKRISTRGEKREIQQARKRKKSSSFLDWWK